MQKTYLLGCAAAAQFKNPVGKLDEGTANFKTTVLRYDR